MAGGIEWWQVIVGNVAKHNHAKMSNCSLQVDSKSWNSWPGGGQVGWLTLSRVKEEHGMHLSVEIQNVLQLICDFAGLNGVVIGVVMYDI